VSHIRPSAIAACLTVEQVPTHRHFGCEHYDRCLDRMQSAPSWSCRGCPLFADVLAEVVRTSPLDTGEQVAEVESLRAGKETVERIYRAVLAGTDNLRDLVLQGNAPSTVSRVLKHLTATGRLVAVRTSRPAGNGPGNGIKKYVRPELAEETRAQHPPRLTNRPAVYCSVSAEVARRVLAAMRPAASENDPGALAQRSNLPRATVNTALRALLLAGAAARTRVNGRYRYSPTGAPYVARAKHEKFSRYREAYLAFISAEPRTVKELLIHLGLSDVRFLLRTSKAIVVGRTNRPPNQTTVDLWSLPDIKRDPGLARYTP